MTFCTVASTDESPSVFEEAHESSEFPALSSFGPPGIGRSRVKKGDTDDRASLPPLAGGMILKTASAAGRHSADYPQV